MATPEQITRTQQDWTAYAGEPVRVEEIGGALYGFASELGTLRIYRKYGGTDNTTQAFSRNMEHGLFLLLPDSSFLKDVHPVVGAPILPPKDQNMRIERNMNLGELAKWMGPQATEHAAAEMRDLLLASDHVATDAIPLDVWTCLLETVAEKLHLEQLQALGFESQADYDEHQRVLKASREMADQQLAATPKYRIAQAIKAGTIKRLYVAGHNVRRGQAVALEYVDAPPVRFYQCSPSKVRAIVERFNRRFGTLQPA